MNTPLIIGILLILIGALTSEVTSDSKEEKADWFLHQLGHYATIFFVGLGLFLVVSGAWKVLEYDMRNKPMEQIQREYDELEARCKARKETREQADKEFYKKLFNIGS